MNEIKTDAQIIELYNKRDEAAITFTSEKYGKYLFSVSKSILENEQDAEECVNDTYLKTWNSIPPQKPVNFKLFICKITRNLSLNRLNIHLAKKRGGKKANDIFEEVEEITNQTADVENEILQSEFTRLLNYFLLSLPRRERGLFIRRYFFMEDISIIAEKYRINEGNVRTILFRARQKFRNLLEREDYVL